MLKRTAMDLQSDGSFFNVKCSAHSSKLHVFKYIYLLQPLCPCWVFEEGPSEKFPRGPLAKAA